MERGKKMAVVYYCRVSAKDQNLARQIEAFKQIGAKEEEIICDKESGKDFGRENYQALKSVLGLRAGDTLVVKELDRFGRNKAEILKELRDWKERGVRVKIMDLTTTMLEVPEGQEWVLEMVNNILIEVLSSLAEQERKKILQRQKEGIACMPVIAGKKVSLKTGNPVGRPKASKPKEWEYYYTEWKAGRITAKEAMDKMHLKRGTFYRFAKE